MDYLSALEKNAEQLATLHVGDGGARVLANGRPNPYYFDFAEMIRDAAKSIRAGYGGVKADLSDSDAVRDAVLRFLGCSGDGRLSSGWAYGVLNDFFIEYCPINAEDWDLLTLEQARSDYGMTDADIEEARRCAGDAEGNLFIGEGDNAGPGSG